MAFLGVGLHARDHFTTTESSPSLRTACYQLVPAPVLASNMIASCKPNSTRVMLMHSASVMPWSGFPEHLQVARSDSSSMVQRPQHHVGLPHLWLLCCTSGSRQYISTILSLLRQLGHDLEVKPVQTKQVELSKTCSPSWAKTHVGPATDHL